MSKILYSYFLIVLDNKSGKCKTTWSNNSIVNNLIVLYSMNYMEHSFVQKVNYLVKVNGTFEY